MRGQVKSLSSRVISLYRPGSYAASCNTSRVWATVLSQLSSATAWAAARRTCGSRPRLRNVARASREAGDVVRLRDYGAVRPGGDEFRRPVGRGGDRRQSAGQGLQDHVAARVIEGGQGQHRGGLIKRRRLGHRPPEPDPVSHPQPFGSLAVKSHIPFAHHPQMTGLIL